MRNIVSAAFTNQADAEAAIANLRNSGVSDRDISVIARGEEEAQVRDGRGDVVHTGGDRGNTLLKGLGVGAGAGALFGLAALAIPGAAPLLAAGALAESFGVAGGAVAAGVIAGGTAGGVAGALTDYGISEEDARFYENRIDHGGVLVAVDATSSGIDPVRLRDILDAAGGTTSARASEGVS